MSGLAKGALTALTAVSILAGAALQTGCDVKSFIDPSEVGRYNKQPLLLPILRKLDTGFDEPDDEWANATDPQAGDLVFTAKDYRIGPGDLLNITISDLAGPGSETQRPIRVSDSGMLSVPLIDEIQASDLTEVQLQRAIQKAYRDGNLILDAQVSVSVVEARARTFSIRGSAVPRSGEYQILKKDFRLLDAIVIAGDILPGAEHAYIIRQQTPTATETPPPGGAPLPPAAPPTTSPGPDILAPRSDIFTPGGAQGAWRIDLLRPKMMQVSGDPNSGGPNSGGVSAPPAAPPEGRYIMLDGKQVLVGAATQPTDAATAAPAIVQEVSPTSPSQPFAFEDLVPQSGERIIRVPLRELLNGNRISKWNWEKETDDTLFTAEDCTSNNGTKSTPALSADLLGDWREEVILRTTDNKELRIFSTTIPTEHRLYTLMHDPQYRLAIAWQNVAYNQPPHPGFFLGAGMKPAPRPNITLVTAKK